MFLGYALSGLIIGIFCALVAYCGFGVGLFGALCVYMIAGGIGFLVVTTWSNDDGHTLDNFEDAKSRRA